VPNENNIPQERARELFIFFHLMLGIRIVCMVLFRPVKFRQPLSMPDSTARDSHLETLMSSLPQKCGRSATGPERRIYAAAAPK
jgi:hypothetical protein